MQYRFIMFLLSVFMLSGLSPGVVHADPFAISFAEKPEHAIIFVIDGLSYKVWDRIELPTLKKMAEIGALVEKNYLPPAAHPHTGVYATLHTCSIPNPIMMAGTVFIDEETEYLSQSFFPRKTTAFVANTISYVSLSHYYHYSYQRGGDDAESVKWALTFMEAGHPAFMRIHLQDSGGAGSRSTYTREDVDWKYNIWGDNSPYRRTIASADSLLGEFLIGLEKLDVLDKTVILVLGDHGQNDSGWHPLEFIDSSITSIVLWGAGIKIGVRIPYAEMIDVVPTVCALMEIEPPETCQGRTIVEALSGYPGEVPPREMLIKEMLEQFVTYRKKMAEASYLVEKISSGKQSLLLTRLGRQIRANFYDIHRFTEWSRFNTIEELLEHNRKVMKNLDAIFEEIKMTQ
jgi:hypothetical protein